MLVAIPIGAFFMALIGDVASIGGSYIAFWHSLSFTCIGAGIVFALLAAVPGAVDYFSVTMSGRAFRIATWHALINLLVVGLYTVSFILRRRDPTGNWAPGATLATLGFGLLGVSGWLGGKLAFEHRVGVVEGPSAVPQRSASESVAS